MTLLETIRTMEVIASRQPSIKMIVENDIFRLNAKADARYGVFAFVQGEHSTAIDTNEITYAFTLFYVDRLKNDRSNQIEIQSVGIQTLDNILRTLDEAGIYAETGYSFQVFNQRFVDECAGVMCRVSLSVPLGSPCSDQFADFSDDFNEDFYIL
jgi:hypothetical protein